jgi:hypothetical protein
MIHYHGLPFSGGLKNEMMLKGKHGFVSFAHSSSVNLAAEICQSFAIDNGAFSAWKSGKDFDLEGYAEYIEQWHNHPAFDFYIMPDSIEGDEQENVVMRSTWFKRIGGRLFGKGVPVWHLHEPLDVLRYFVRAYDRIALGSSGEYGQIGNDKWWERMAEAMSILCDNEGRPKVKLHGLRMLDPAIFSQFPFSSADSTNVGRNCGLDNRWEGPYTTGISATTRAVILIDRIESHTSAVTWSRPLVRQQTFELIG